MAEFEYTYTGIKDRQEKVAEAEAKGLRMLHDNFNQGWKTGDEPFGTMIFTDVHIPSPTIEKPRDAFAELDELKAEVALLKKAYEPV